MVTMDMGMEFVDIKQRRVRKHQEEVYFYKTKGKWMSVFISPDIAEQACMIAGDRFNLMADKSRALFAFAPSKTGLLTATCTGGQFRFNSVDLCVTIRAMLMKRGYKADEVNAFKAWAVDGTIYFTPKGSEE